MFQEEKAALEAALNKEQKRRERTEKEATVLQMAKKDLESRAQVLEAQIEFYRNNPPLASLQVTLQLLQGDACSKFGARRSVPCALFDRSWTPTTGAHKFKR